jgi:predicted GNAT family acetyltransferase
MPTTPRERPRRIGSPGNGAAFGVDRIGPVYTPPEARGRGYGSAVTAHLTQHIRAGGADACLFTDLANPTSNKIYAAIGYRPVADFHRYRIIR